MAAKPHANKRLNQSRQTGGTNNVLTSGSSVFELAVPQFSGVSDAGLLRLQKAGRSAGSQLGVDAENERLRRMIVK